MANLREGALETKPCRYGTISFFKNDTTVSRSLKEYGEWAQAEIELLRHLISPSDTVLDIGAFIGTHTLAFAQKVKPSGKVYAFEPQAAFFEVLKKNIAQNALTNVTVFNTALSDEAGQLWIPEIDVCHTYNFGGISLLEIGATSDSAPHHTVEVTTVDHLALKRCDLIKIDAENMEINVLKGARKTIGATRPTIFAECNSLEYGWPLVELLRKEGYCSYLLNASSYNPDNFRSDPGNFLQHCRETGLLLIPTEHVRLIQDRLDPTRYPLLISVSCIDDLALGLLKKPQYKYEIASKVTAASVLGADFWANEPEVHQLREEIQQQKTTVVQKVEEVARLTREREALQDMVRQQETAVAEKVEEVARLTREREALQDTLNRIYDSHVWKPLSLYYTWKDKLLPDGNLRRGIAKCLRSPRNAWEGVRLLLDMRLIAASKLFDSDWYMGRNPDVAKAGVNPLRHYLRQGAIEGRDPNPFFDSDWYLERNPDVARAGVNPLAHYVRQGAIEGRDPNPLFDSARYLQQHPDVAKARLNPLAHHLASSATNQGLGPTTNFPTRPTESLGTEKKAGRPKKRLMLEPRPIVSPAQPPRLRHGIANRRLICVSHVLPYPVRAGNEYRIHRMLTLLAGRGFDIFLVVCPLPGDPITTERLADACAIYPNIILCQRDGTLFYRLADGDVPMKALSGVRPRVFAKLLGEKDSEPGAQKLLSIVRTFCPDLLIEVLLHLDATLQPQVFWVNYVWMTRAFPLVRAGVLKVVDTIDVFSTKSDKVEKFGIEDGCAVTPEEEAKLLGQANLVIAIQPEEASELRRLAPNKPIITAGVDFDSIDFTPVAARHPIILLVGSDNQLNVKGLKDFLRFAWQLICREVPDAELRIVGAVGSQVEIDDPSVKVLGGIDSLDAAYAEARVVINPAIAGTGLKIKTVQALCHLRPVVAWPSGVEGIEAELQGLCYVATNWYSFARHVISLCNEEDGAYPLLKKRDEIRQAFSADTIYKELDVALSALPSESMQSSLGSIEVFPNN